MHTKYYAKRFASMKGKTYYCFYTGLPYVVLTTTTTTTTTFFHLIWKPPVSIEAQMEQNGSAGV